MEPGVIPQKSGTKVEEKKPSIVLDKSFDLAFIGGAPFMHLAKSKKQKTEIFAISMQDIKYQLNKETKLLTDLKTVIPAKYHDFLDVFLKEAFDMLRPYGKSNYKIKLLKNTELSDLGHSVLRRMSIP